MSDAADEISRAHYKHIESAEEFGAIEAKARQVFYLDRVLYENPFKERLHLSFMCYNHLGSVEFGELLKKITNHFGDDCCYAMVQEPSPDAGC